MEQMPCCHQTSSVNVLLIIGIICVMCELVANIMVFCDMFRNVKENLMTSYKNDLFRPKLTCGNC